MRTFSLSFVFFFSLVFSSKAQTVEQKIDKYIKSNSLRKNGEYLVSTTMAGTCSISDRKEIKVNFIRKGLDSPAQDSIFNIFTTGMVGYLYRDILTHYPEYDRLTISVFNEVTGKTESMIFYLLGSKIFTNDNGTMKIVDY